MKYKLKKDLTKHVDIPTKNVWETQRVTLEGEELIQFLRPNLIDVMAEILDPDTAGKSPDGYLRNLQSNRLGDFSKRYIISAVDGDKVIGLLIALPEEENCLHIITVGVVTSYRKKGVASTLLKRCIDDSLKKGIESLVLDVHEVNSPANSLYGKFGFFK